MVCTRTVVGCVLIRAPRSSRCNVDTLVSDELSVGGGVWGSQGLETVECLYRLLSCGCLGFGVIYKWGVKVQEELPLRTVQSCVVMLTPTGLHGSLHFQYPIMKFIS